MNTKFFICLAAFASSSSLTWAESLSCESADNSATFSFRENDPPAESADWRIAKFTRSPYKQTSVYEVSRTSRADRVLYVTGAGNRKAARLDLGVYNAKGEYPEASLVTYVAGGGYRTTAMACTIEGKINFVNHCSDSRKDVLGKR